MITRYDSLDISPEEGTFFQQHEFYSHLKGDIVAEDGYNNSTIKIYNFQDTIILC